MKNLPHCILNHISGIRVNVLVSSALECWFEPLSGQIKDHNIGIGFLSAKHASLMSKSKVWSTWNQDSVSEWSNMSTRGLL